MLLQWEPACLTLFPEERWRELLPDLLEFRRRSGAHRNKVRQVLQHGGMVSPDKLGRIVIPQRLRERNKFTDKVIVAGNLDRVEIWHPDLYGKEIDTDESPDVDIEILR